MSALRTTSHLGCEAKVTRRSTISCKSSRYFKKEEIIMATLLDKYENTTGEITVPAGESAGKAEQQPVLTKKERKIFKALAKALRKHNKLLKQEAERRKAEEEAAAKAAAEKAAKRKNGGGFLGGFTKVICKVLPQIVTAAVTAVLGFFFHRKPSKRALRAAL